MTVKAMPVHSLLISLLLAVLVAGGVLLVGTQAQAQQDPLPPFFIRCDIGTPSPGAVGICAETFPPDYPPPNAGGGTGLVFCPAQDASDGTIECITTVPGTTGTQPNDVSTCTFVETLANNVPPQLVDVYHCNAPPPGQGQQPAATGGSGGGGGGGGGGGATPITQDSEQDSESGEIDQSFDVS